MVKVTKHMGVLMTSEDKGIIPLTCEELFRMIEERKAADPSLLVLISPLFYFDL
jgi:hypothetical protein